MKKLMIAAAIVCAAAFAQAANFSWGLTNYEIASADDAHDDGFGYATADTICKLFIGDTLIIQGTMEDDGTFGVVDNSAVDTTGKVQTLAAGDIDFVGQAYKLVLQTADGQFEVVMDGLTSTYASVAQGAGEDSLNYENFLLDREITRGDWVAVPEPTSGLLLLLGVAGLALKRKRA